MGKFLHFFEKLASFGRHIDDFIARISAFFNIFSRTFVQLNLLLNNILLLLGSLRLVLQPLTLLHQSLNVLLGSLCSGYFKALSGLNRTKQIYRSTTFHVQGYLNPVQTQLESLMNMWTNISHYLPGYLDYALKVVIVPTLALVLLVLRVFVGPLTFLHSLYIQDNNGATNTTKEQLKKD